MKSSKNRLGGAGGGGGGGAGCPSNDGALGEVPGGAAWGSVMAALGGKSRPLLRPQPDRPTAAIAAVRTAMRPNLNCGVPTKPHSTLEPRATLPDRRRAQKDFEQVFAGARYSAFSPSFASHFFA
jgi:hypothetical protein